MSKWIKLLLFPLFFLGFILFSFSVLIELPLMASGFYEDTTKPFLGKYLDWWFDL